MEAWLQWHAQSFRRQGEGIAFLILHHSCMCGGWRGGGQAEKFPGHPFIDDMRAAKQDLRRKGEVGPE